MDAKLQRISTTPLNANSQCIQCAQSRNCMLCLYLFVVRVAMWRFRISLDYSHFVVLRQARHGYVGLDWTLLFRDLIPRRHATLPYALNASPEIVSQSGPSLKHSVSFEYRTNGRLCDDWLNPTFGMDVNGKVEVAGPPGDTGFVKMQGGASLNVPLPQSCAFHGSVQAGILRSIPFGGLCGPASISDRFFVGGPLHLRGFLPAGIGPRAKTVSEPLVARISYDACRYGVFLTTCYFSLKGRRLGTRRRCAWGRFLLHSYNGYIGSISQHYSVST